MFCKNCGCNDVKKIHDKIWGVNNGTVYQCCNCELVFLDPMMTDEEEIEFYKNYNEHVRKRTSSNYTIDKFHASSLSVAKERYEIVKHYFKNKKVLEIGSSTGAFLSLLEGCETNACELAVDNLEYSKRYINGKAYSKLENIEDKKFDIICAFHVFEHIKTPVDFLNNCKKLLIRGGDIY